MAFPKTPKPVTASHGKPVSEFVAFAGHNEISNTPLDHQAQRLARLFLLAEATATAIASLAYGVAR